MEDVDRLRADIAAGTLDSWPAIHRRYDELWQAYPRAKQRHAFAVLRELYGGGPLNEAQWLHALGKAVELAELICRRVHQSREKDFANPFRRQTLRNAEDMAATVGTLDDSEFLRRVRQETDDFKQRVERAPGYPYSLTAAHSGRASRNCRP